MFTNNWELPPLTHSCSLFRVYLTTFFVTNQPLTTDFGLATATLEPRVFDATVSGNNSPCDRYYKHEGARRSYYYMGELFVKQLLLYRTRRTWGVPAYHLSRSDKCTRFHIGLRTFSIITHICVDLRFGE